MFASNKKLTTNTLLEKLNKNQPDLYYALADEIRDSTVKEQALKAANGKEAIIDAITHMNSVELRTLIINLQKRGVL